MPKFPLLLLILIVSFLGSSQSQASTPTDFLTLEEDLRKNLRALVTRFSKPLSESEKNLASGSRAREIDKPMTTSFLDEGQVSITIEKMRIKEFAEKGGDKRIFINNHDQLNTFFKVIEENKDKIHTLYSPSRFPEIEEDFYKRLKEYPNIKTLKRYTSEFSRVEEFTSLINALSQTNIEELHICYVFYPHDLQPEHNTAISKFLKFIADDSKVRTLHIEASDFCDKPHQAMILKALETNKSLITLELHSDIFKDETALFQGKIQSILQKRKRQ